MITSKLNALVAEYSHDTFNYFSRLATQLSENTELANVLKSDAFNVSKPILYVLYGSESKLVKVGKTISSTNRLKSYLYSKGKPSTGNNFRKDDTIHLVGYYLLPDFDYDDPINKRFMSGCEKLLIANAKQLFGETVYSKEWFNSKQETYVMMSKLPKLFHNLNRIVDDSMYRISSQLFEQSKQEKQPNNKQSKQKQFMDDSLLTDMYNNLLDELTDYGMLDNESISTESLYQAYLAFCHRSRIKHIMTKQKFSKDIIKYMSKRGFEYSGNKRKVFAASNSAVYNHQQFLDYFKSNPNYIDISQNLKSQQRYFSNQANKLPKSEIESVKSNVMDLDESQIMENNRLKRILYYLAYDENNSFALSLLGA